MPEGATRVAVVINQWDPKNDLAAFVDVRKTAWESSGFTILDEEPLTLDLGWLPSNSPFEQLTVLPSYFNSRLSVTNILYQR